MDHFHPKINYLFKSGTYHEHQINSICYLNGEVEDVLCFLLNKYLIAVKVNQNPQEDHFYEKGSPLSSMCPGKFYYFCTFKNALKACCVDHCHGLLYILDIIGHLWVIKTNEMLESMTEEQMELDEDIFSDQKSSRPRKKRKIDVTPKFLLSLLNGFDISTADNTLYIVTQENYSIKLHIFELDTESLTLHAKIVISTNVEYSISKINLIYNDTQLRSVNSAVKLKQTFYKKLFNDSSSSSLIMSIETGGIFHTHPSSNSFTLLCDLQQDLAGLLGINLLTVTVKYDNLISSQQRKIIKLTSQCFSLIGKKGKCLTKCFFEKQNYIIILNNQLPKDVVCCNNRNDIIVVASEMDVTIFKANLTIKDDADIHALKNGDVFMELECLQILRLSFISNIITNVSDSVIDIIVSNSFGKIMRFQCGFERQEGIEESCDLVTYEKTCSELKELQSTSISLNQQLASLSTIGHTLQEIIRQPSLIAIKFDTKIVLQESSKKVILEIRVQNNSMYTLKSDWFLSLHYYQLFDKQHLKTQIETVRLNNFAHNDIEFINCTLLPEYITNSPVKCDIYLQLVPLSSTRPISIHIKTCVFDLLHFFNCGDDTMKLNRNAIPQKLLESYDLVLKLNGNALKRYYKTVIASSMLRFPTNIGIEKVTNYKHVNGSTADISVKLEEDENVTIRVTSNKLLLIIGIHSHLLHHFKGRNLQPTALRQLKLANGMDPAMIRRYFDDM